MVTKIIKPTLKGNSLAAELKPFINDFTDEYKASYCLFSQYTKYELLDFYIYWNWFITKSDNPDKEIIKLLSTLIANFYRLLCMLDKREGVIVADLETVLRTILNANLKGASLMDKLVIYHLDVVFKDTDNLKVAALTRLMFLNSYLVQEKTGILEYEI